MENTGDTQPLRLGDFIIANIEPILAAWEDYARAYWRGPIPGPERLRNDAEMMLRAVVLDMGIAQTQEQQKRKSEGEFNVHENPVNRAAQAHALTRVRDGFDVERMVAEFRALRASVSRIWWKSIPLPHKDHVEDMSRFNEALDQLVAASVTAFTGRAEQSRRLFLAILGHDLRQPLVSMGMFHHLLQDPELPRSEVPPILASMDQCRESIWSMLNDLLDFTSSQLGSVMPIRPAHCSLRDIASGVLVELEAAYPARKFIFEAEGLLEGDWDECRLRQLLSNLLCNAVQYGYPSQPIELLLSGNDAEATLRVLNSGDPVPAESMEVIFDPMVRLAATEKLDHPHGSIGLGLYICRQVALAHGGEIHVASLPGNVTSFAVTLPKQSTAGEVALE
jgi:signal transduction histidine kinase